MSVADKLGWGPSRAAIHLEDGNWEIRVTPPLFMGEYPTLEIKLTPDQYSRYLRWRNDECLLQDALPELTDAEREVLLTGLGDDDFHDIAMDRDEDPDDHEDEDDDHPSKLR